MTAAATVVRIIVLVEVFISRIGVVVAGHVVMLQQLTLSSIPAALLRVIQTEATIPQLKGLVLAGRMAVLEVPALMLQAALTHVQAAP
jgi:hypothetical protein